MCQPRVENPLATLSIKQKIELIQAILEDLTPELLATYKYVDVVFRVQAK